MVNWKSPASVALAMLLAFSVAGCDERTSTATCLSTYDSYTSPTTGVLTLQGHFLSNESILVRDAATNNLVASGTPATDRTSFSFTNIPSGTHGYDIVASCDAGQETIHTGVFDIK